MTVLDSGFRDVEPRTQLLDSRFFFRWNPDLKKSIFRDSGSQRVKIRDSTSKYFLNSGFLNLVFGLQRVWFRISKVRIPDSKGQDSGFQRLGFRSPKIRIPDSMMWTHEPRYWIQDSSSGGIRIPKSLFSGIPDPKEQDSWFYEQIFFRFRIPWPGFRTPKSRIPYFKG